MKIPVLGAGAVGSAFGGRLSQAGRLATLAAITGLMRGTVGDLRCTDDGAALLAQTWSACKGAAADAGYPPRDSARARVAETQRQATVG